MKDAAALALAGHQRLAGALADLKERDSRSEDKGYLTYLNARDYQMLTKTGNWLKSLQS